MMKKKHNKFNFLLIVMIVVLSGLYGIFADTNGIFFLAQDIRGGTFGSDEQNVTTDYTFINPLFVNESLSVTSYLKVGFENVACDSTTEGSIRYNSGSKEMEYCNGTDWTALGGAIGSGLTFTSNFQTVSEYGSVFLFWSATGHDSCIASGDWNGIKANTGFEQINDITIDKEFKLTCIDDVADTTQRTINVAIDNSQCISGGRNFTQIGTQETFRIPTGCDTVTVELMGAGGEGNGGTGAFAKGTFGVTPGDFYSVIIGVSGSNSTSFSGGGGSANNNRGGGGYSGIFNGSISQSKALVIAGGGGGGGDGGGGNAGFPSGERSGGIIGHPDGLGGVGGTQSSGAILSGGGGGSGTYTGGCGGQATIYGGNGGGGYHGGSGGGTAFTGGNGINCGAGFKEGGGGGGSSYTKSGVVTDVSHVSGGGATANNDGYGQVRWYSKSNALSHISGRITFDASWIINTSETNCIIQNSNGGTFVDIANITCSTGTGSFTLNDTGSNWDGRQVRIVLASDSSVLKTFFETLSCIPITYSTSPTPTIDEDCDGNFDNTEANTDGTYGTKIFDRDGCSQSGGVDLVGQSCTSGQVHLFANNPGGSDSGCGQIGSGFQPWQIFRNECVISSPIRYY